MHLQDLDITEDIGGSLVQTLRDGWTGAPDGTLPESFGFIPRLHRVKSPMKKFGKARQNSRPSHSSQPISFLFFFFAAGQATQLQLEASYKWGAGED